VALKYDYTPRMGPTGIEYDPFVDVVFTNPSNGLSVEIRCLIDSGAGGIILSAEFAELLGLDLKRGDEHLYQGIAHDPVSAYDHELMIRLKEDRHAFRVVCSLMPGLKASGLLGQRGFFDHYKVVFERAKKRIELTPLSSSTT
jgi:hypothetical protein